MGSLHSGRKKIKKWSYVDSQQELFVAQINTCTLTSLELSLSQNTAREAISSPAC